MVFSEKKLLWWNLIIKEKIEFALSVCTSHKAQFNSIATLELSLKYYIVKDFLVMRHSESGFWEALSLMLWFGM